MKRSTHNVSRVLVAVLLTLGAAARAEVVRGNDRDTVIRELGNADGRTAIGSTEILSYRNGTTVTLEHGVVVEIAQKGNVAGLTHPYVPAARARTTADSSGLSSAANSPSQPATPVTRQAQPAPVLPKPTLPSTPARVTVGENDTKAPGTIKPGSARPTATPAFNLPAALIAFPTQANLARVGVIARVFMLGLLTVGLGVYAFMSHCLKRICLKAGEDPGVLIWIPIAQTIPLLRVAQLPELLALLLFVPVVNFVFILFLWAKVCSALGKNPWLVLLLLVPVLNLLLILYLAFCDGGSDKTVSKQELAPPPLRNAAPTPASI